MGGYGSTRWAWEATRRTTDEYLNFDVRRVHQAGLFYKGSYPWSWTWWRGGKKIASIVMQAPCCEPDFVTLTYSVSERGEDWQRIEEPVRVEWITCNYGGIRPWWRCRGCGRRCAILYGGRLFRCRHCHRLAYASSRESRADRMLRKANAIRDRLRDPPGRLAAGLTQARPKGMHRKTYWRLVEREERLRSLALISFAWEHGILALAPGEERLLELVLRGREVTP